jgi:short-subunit dehydrogenase
MKKAIVVGASSGIGKKLALLLAEQDYLVGIVGRRDILLNELKASRPNQFIVAAIDITEPHTTTQKLEALVHEIGGLDLVIFCAGVGDENPHLNFQIESHTIAVNVFGFTAIADWAFHFFKNQKHGHFAAITSIAGIRANELNPAYNASKAFQLNYMEALQQKKIKYKLPLFITDIRPGFVNTHMAKSENKFWMATVDEVAKQILVAIDNKVCVAYVPKRWELVALIFQLIPRWLSVRIGS